MKIRLSLQRKQGLTHMESLVLPSAGSARVLSISLGRTTVRVAHIRKASVPCVERRFWTPKTTSRPPCDDYTCDCHNHTAGMGCAFGMRSSVPSSCASSTVGCVYDTAKCVCSVHARGKLGKTL